MMQFLVKITLALWTVYLMGCIPTGAAGKKNNSSLLAASTEGFAKEDLKNLKAENVTLMCSKSQTEKPIEVKPLKVSEKAMEFPGDQLEDGMNCYLLVRGNVDPKMKYTWLGVDGEGKPAVGLFYMSENATIKGGQLQLPIVKLYSVQPSDSFNASLVVLFNGKEPVSDENNSEQYQVKLSAEITCQLGDETFKHRSLPAGKIAGQDRIRSFMFSDLSVKKMKAATCSKVSVYEGNNDLVYIADRLAPPLMFAGAQVGGTLTFNVSVEKHIAPEPFKRTATPAVKCLKKDSNGICTQFELKNPETPWVAEVAILNSTRNTSETFFVTTYDRTQKVIDVATLNTDLLAFTPTQRSSLRVYNKDAQSQLLSSDFDKLTEAEMANQEVNFTLVTDNIQFVSFINVWTHGFHQVNPETQVLSTGSKNAERWIALVDVKLADKTQAQFAIAGADQYFGSQRRANGKLFDWQTFVAENKANAPKAYSVYTYADALIGQSGLSCATPLSTYLEEMGAVLPEQMSWEKTEIQYCEVQGFPAAYLEGHTADVQMYIYGWHKH